jgi:hypothetical protein
MNENKNRQVYLQDAIDWTGLWREKCPDNCKAFLIPVEDMVAILKKMNILQLQKDGHYAIDEGSDNDIRAYLGIDPKLMDQPGKGEKLVMVATQKFPDSRFKSGYIHKDIINGKIDNEGPIIKTNPNNLRTAQDPEPNTGIYDFTSPCPDACDPGSPLFGG